MRKSIKKIFAIGVSAALLATTMVGALADLSTYPAPFVGDNGVFNGAIVVGASAATSDVLGAIDIAASLQAEAKTAVSVGDSSVSVTGGKDYDNNYLGGEWPNEGDITLKENKLAGFVDSSFSVAGDNVNYHDELLFDNASVDLNNPTSSDAAGRIYSTVAKNALEYRVVFEDTEIANANADHTASFKFLGQTVEAYDFNFSANTAGDVAFTILSSTDKSMVEGDEVTVGGHTVKLVRVGADSAIIDVDGQSKVVDKSTSTSDNTETYSDADDFQVEVESIFYVDGASDNIANVKLGTDLTESAKLDKPAELFGQSDVLKEADWTWTVGTDTNGNNYVGVKSNIAYDNLDIQKPSEQRAPLFLGDSVSLPNDYAALEFASLAATYSDVTISLDDRAYLSENEDQGNDGYYAVIEFEADSDIFKIGSDTSDTVYIAYNVTTGADNDSARTIWYNDNGDDVKSAASSFDIYIDSEAVTVTSFGLMNSTTPNVVMTDKDSKALTFWVNNSIGTENFFNFFGSADDSDALDLKYVSNAIGSKDFDYQTPYGIKIANPNDQFDSGSSFMISVPSEKEYATYVVSSSGSSVSAAASGSAYMINPIDVGMGMLDSEATLGSKPMIVVGGPYANTLAKELLGFPTDEEIAQTFTEGKAMIKWFDDEQAMLVAGWSAQDTRGASYVVANYDEYDFTGDELEVVVTDLTNINVAAK